MKKLLHGLLHAVGLHSHKKAVRKSTRKTASRRAKTAIRKSVKTKRVNRTTKRKRR